MTNPLLANAELPKFGEIRPEHIAEAVNAMVEAVTKGLARIEADPRPPSWDTLIEELNTLEEWDTRVWHPVVHLNMVLNGSELRAAYQAAQPKVVGLWLKFSQSEAVYAKLLKIRGGAEWARLSVGQRRAVEKRILKAELSGIALKGEKKERFNQIEERLSRLGTKFTDNVIDATKEFKLVLTARAEVDGLSVSVREMLAQSYARNTPGTKADPENGPWLVTLDLPVYNAFMQFAKSRPLREKLYRAYVTRASSGATDNGPGMNETLALRAEKAALLGYKNYAGVSLATKMARSTDEVDALLEELRQASLGPAREELAEAGELALASGHTGALELWDVPYWAKRLEEKRFGYTEDELRPYFSLGKVLDGLFGVTQRLFGVTVRPADGEVPVWHKDVRYFEVLGADGKRAATFYLDPYSRPENKRGGAWMDAPASRRSFGGVRRLPAVYLVCNFTPPVGDKPSLLAFSEVKTLFHEFGHGLQHMLTTIEHLDVSGVAGVEWDAIELASQFMENWCYHPETLRGLARHYQSGEPLPEAIFRKLLGARVFRAGTQTLRLVYMSMVDLAIHTAEKPDILGIARELAAKAAAQPPLPEDRSLCALTHIFTDSYAAGLYSYKWAEVLSADAFEAFEEAGLDDPAAVARTGARYRDTVLALGGSEHPGEVFKKFRGRAPSVKALLRHNALLRA